MSAVINDGRCKNMDFNKIIEILKSFLLKIFTEFGVSEEFAALGIDIGAILAPEEPSSAE